MWYCESGNKVKLNQKLLFYQEYIFDPCDIRWYKWLMVWFLSNVITNAQFTDKKQFE